MTWPPFAVHSGDPVPGLERTIDAAAMVAYAGATWDWHRLHYDAVYLSEHGIASPVVDGQLFGALLMEMLQDWLGPSSFVRTIEFRFRELVYAGERVRCSGTVEDVTRAAIRCTLSVDVVEGPEIVRTAVAPARAEVVPRP